jgi:phosphate transport system substrate-binding protein
MKGLRRITVVTLVLSVLSVVASLGVGQSAANASNSYALIQGSGSSWAENALDQWIADVNADGMQVVFTGSGSAQGRKDFANRTVDFADSEIGYQGRDPLTGDSDTSLGRAYAYLPVVGGGTSFPYQIKVAGKPVTNLRLSGESIVKIFTGAITYWDDPAITADNNGRVLPHLKIIPVVHSEGSGSTAQLTKYFATEFPSIWSKYAGVNNFTEYYPRANGEIAQNGSSQVINYVESSAANGAIGYDEYSYALLGGFPVAKMLNKAGYYTLPTQYNVAVALTQAIINENKSSPNYLLQDLHKVYVYDDPRTYPLSSYSYGILPTAPSPPETKMTTAKRQTLADFFYYGICQGQKEVGPIGYSPLPVNLVQAGFSQLAKLKAADPGVDLTSRSVATCNNPTFVAGQPNQNHLAKIAPQPAACDQAGAGPCAGGAGSAIIAGSQSGASGSTASGASGSSTGSTTSPTAAATSAAVSGPTRASGASVAQSGATSEALGPPVLVASLLGPYRQPALVWVAAPLAVLALLAVLVTPPVVVTRARRRRGVVR